MRDRDRWWWSLLLAGLAFCACGVAAPYVGVRTIPTDDPYITSADYWQLMGLVGLLTLVCLGGGLTFVFMAIHARRQHRKRLAALQGDVRAMPLATIHSDPVLAPVVVEKPLEMMWRLGTASKIVNILQLVLQGLVALTLVGSTIFSLVAPIFISRQSSAEDMLNGTLPQPISVTEIILRIAGACAVVALAVVIGILFVRVMPHLFGRPFGISVTNSGIDARTELGSRIHMVWGEMRLLEVDKGDTKSKRRFALYAQGKRITWTEYTTGLGAQYKPVGATMSEMTVRQAVLLSLIEARTGLTPRTLAKSLESKPAPTRTVKRSSGFVALLALVLFLAGIIAADILLPMTPVTWVKWVSVGSLALTVCCLIIASLWTASARRPLLAHASPPSVGAPSLDAPEVAYVLSWRAPLLRRLTLIFIGLCLAVNLVPGVWALLLLFGLSLPGYHPQLLFDGVFAFMGRFALAFILAMFGLIGLALIYGGMIAATVRIQADKDGLKTGSGRREQMMVWSSVQDISWGPGVRGQFAYQVESDAPTFQITWPADPQLASAGPPSDGAMPIGADELAALVATRINKPIRVRE